MPITNFVPKDKLLCLFVTVFLVIWGTFLLNLNICCKDKIIYVRPLHSCLVHSLVIIRVKYQINEEILLKYLWNLAIADSKPKNTFLKPESTAT